MAKKKSDSGAATATETKPPQPQPKPKQGHLDGMAPPSVPEIDRAAAAYVAVRDERMSITKTEVEKKTILLHTMQKHGFTTYEFDGNVVKRTSKDNVKVNRKGDDDIDIDSEDED